VVARETGISAPGIYLLPGVFDIGGSNLDASDSATEDPGAAAADGDENPDPLNDVLPRPTTE